MKWGGRAGTGVTVEYSFAEVGSRWVRPYGEYGEPTQGFRPLNAQQETAAEAALQAWAEVANIRFVEVEETSSAAGTIRFGITDASPTAHAYYPGPDPEAGDIWLGSGYHLGETDYRPGTYAYHTLVHELGHTLGLQHPHEGGARSDWLGTSVMSYRSFPGDSTVDSGYTNDFFPTGPMLDDIRAIQHLYGTNTTTRSGDTSYGFVADRQYFRTLYDAGGTDLIDAGGMRAAVEINLAPGSWSRIGPAYTWWEGGTAPGTVAIAHGTWIENAAGGRGNDGLTGNARANTLWGNDGNDRLAGGAGNDQLGGGTGNDRLDGGTGGDMLRGGPGSDALAGGDGSDRFVFDDGDSAAGNRRDVLADFDPAGDGDRIDLRLVDARLGTAGDQAFAWIGNRAFTGTGQLRWSGDADLRVVAGNQGGDLRADFEIAIDDLARTPDSSWFLL